MRAPLSLDENGGARPEENLAGNFNPESTPTPEETELKRLVIDARQIPLAFAKVEAHFRALGWIRSTLRDRHLLTYQYDTPERELFNRPEKAGIRIRYQCEGDDLNNLTTTDLCVKIGKEEQESGAIKRGEFEVKHPTRFKRILLERLRKKFPKEKHPELHATLDSIDPERLVLHGRIDVIRERHVLEVPESATGIIGKKVFGELLLDRVVFVLDLPELKKPLIIDYDGEIENENLMKACDYDPDPEKLKFVSSPDLTDREKDIANAAIAKQLDIAAPGMLKENTLSKMERLFKALDEAIPRLRNILVPTKPEKRHSLTTAFNAQGVDPDGKLHAPSESARSIFGLLANKYYWVLERHPVAYKKRAPNPAANTNDTPDSSKRPKAPK